MENILNSFETISLKEMDKVKLMNRKECKYTLSVSDLLSILVDVKNNYYMLEIDNEKLMPYESVYYDRPDFSLYTSHQNGKLNRYKIRSRTYAISGQKYLELKFKNNKMMTIKNRIQVNESNTLHDNYEFLAESLPFSPHLLEKKIEIKYQRITLVDKNMSERVTIDLNLSYTTKDKESDYNGIAVIEVKYQGEKRDSSMVTALMERRIKSLSFSKYCLGISQHYPEVKQNSMNNKVRQINKLLSFNTTMDEQIQNWKRIS